MIKITLIAMGKLKEKYFLSACDEYAKRLSRYCDLKTVEIQPEALRENPSESEIDAALKKEAEKIEKAMPKSCLAVALCVEGISMTSEDFSALIGDCQNSGKEICFIIGSSHGLHGSIKARSDIKLSLSEMTFPHRLFRVMLLEQIYRGFKINEGGNYHK